ncbi:MAG: TPM domain-containing protein [bacterium]|nr:TPM domain-containing protein [bacterium]
MTEKIQCRLCGHEFTDTDQTCPGCGVEVKNLTGIVALPPPKGSVNDYAGILSETEVNELSGKLESHFNLTDVPVVVATVKGTDPLDPSGYAFLLYNSWGIGHPHLNMGLLVLLCLDMQHIECEVGIGLEKYIPEVEGDEILEETFYPYFREKKYYEGLIAGTEVLMDLIRKRVPPVKHTGT